LVNAYYLVGISYRLVSSSVVVVKDRLYLLGYYDTPSDIALDSDFKVVAARTIDNPDLFPWFITTDGTHLYIGLINSSDWSMVILATDLELNSQWAVKWEPPLGLYIIIDDRSPIRDGGILYPGNGGFASRFSNAIYYNGKIYVPYSWFTDFGAVLSDLLVIFDVSTRRVVRYYSIVNTGVIFLLSTSAFSGRGGGWIAAVGVTSASGIEKQFVEDVPPVKPVSLVLSPFEPVVYPVSEDLSPKSISLADYPLNAISVDPPPDALLFLIPLPPAVGGVVDVGLHFVFITMGLALLVALGVKNARARK